MWMGLIRWGVGFLKWCRWVWVHVILAEQICSHMWRHDQEEMELHGEELRRVSDKRCSSQSMVCSSLHVLIYGVFLTPWKLSRSCDIFRFCSKFSYLLVFIWNNDWVDNLNGLRTHHWIINCFIKIATLHTHIFVIISLTGVFLASNERSLFVKLMHDIIFGVWSND